MGCFCRECGTELIEKDCNNEGMVPYCPKCEQFRFPQYNVAVSMIILNASDGKILLVQQYGSKKNILVAGYINQGETAEEAVRREVKEETGLTVTAMKFNRTNYYEPSNTLMCNFTVFVADAEDFHPNSEIDAFHWFTPREARENIHPNSLAAHFLNSYLDEFTNICK